MSSFIGRKNSINASKSKDNFFLNNSSNATTSFYFSIFFLASEWYIRASYLSNRLIAQKDCTRKSLNLHVSYNQPSIFALAFQKFLKVELTSLTYEQFI